MNEKTCPKCGRVLSLENFARNARMRDGVQCWCKDCLKAYRQARTVIPEQQERERQRKRDYRQTERGRTAQRDQMSRYRATPEGRAATRSADAAYHERHRERRNAQKRAWLADAEVKAQVNAQRRMQRLENPEIALARRESYKRYIEAERESVNQRRREQYHRNPEQFRARAALVRAKRAYAAGCFSGDDVRNAFSKQSGRCLYCGCIVGRNAARWEVDHFVPLSRGGTNDPENIVIACFDCNRSKSNKMPWEFKPEKFEVIPM